MHLLQKNKIQLILILALLTSTMGYSQNILQGSVNRDLKQAARQTVEMWSAKLVLSAKQRKLMEDKIVEFSIKKNELLQSKMRQELKAQKLKELQILQNRDMRDILTKPQYDKYLAILKDRYADQKDQLKRE